MFKSTIANRVVSLVLYWFIVIIVSSNDYPVNNPILLILIAILTILFTVYQLYRIFKVYKK